MQTYKEHLNAMRRCLGMFVILTHGFFSFSNSLAQQETTPSKAILVSSKGAVHFVRDGSNTWDPVYKDQKFYPGDRIRTGEEAEAVLRLTDDGSMLRLDELSDLALPKEKSDGVIFQFFRGILHLFHRGSPGDYEVRSPGISTIIRGTEFLMTRADNGEVTIHMVHGAVALKTSAGQIDLIDGEVGVAMADTLPNKLPSVSVIAGMQWELYYPGFLYWADLPFNEQFLAVLFDSLESFQKGDPTAALAKFRASISKVNGKSSSFALYHATLLLNSGNYEAAIEKLSALASFDDLHSNEQEILHFLQSIITMIQGRSWEFLQLPSTASGWLARSILLQSEMKLQKAKDAAYESVALAPDFGYAWAQIAELEFGFGNSHQALTAADRSLKESPMNANAWSVKGFLLLAEGDYQEATTCFEKAIKMQPRLGSAWLGKGLIQIKQGHRNEGMRNFETAVAMEPQKAFYRSYLARALSETRALDQASKELLIAAHLDPNDPTVYYFTALLNFSRNRINQAIEALETAQALNDQRGLFRSKFLLDSDRAIKGANLAVMYWDIGLENFAYREAVAAVQADYLNESGHLFLAESYNHLRDPMFGDLRYETPWFSEYLLSRLLASPGSASVSPLVSQQEYTRMFDQNHLGFVSDTQYLSRGDITQSFAQYGFHKRLNYSIDGTIRSLNGTRAFQEFEDRTFSLRLKQGIGENDSVFLQSVFLDGETQDLNRYYDPANASRSLRVEEQQQPLFLGGYQRYWSATSRTLLLGAYFKNDFVLSQEDFQRTMFLEDLSGNLDAVSMPGAALSELRYSNAYEGFSLEPQHLLKSSLGVSIIGARYQSGNLTVSNDITTSSSSPFQNNAGTSPFTLAAPAISGQFNPKYERYSVYAYQIWEPWKNLQATMGFAYDRMDHPSNFFYPPANDRITQENGFLPKSGLTWQAREQTRLRLGYSESLGGIGLENSIQIEPSQLAGFTQNYRSLLPESVVGTVIAEQRKVTGLAIDQKWRSKTYMTLGLDKFQSAANREFEVSSIDLFPTTQFDALTVNESLDLEEYQFHLRLNQLLDDYWSLGIGYQLSDTKLRTDFRNIPDELVDLIGESNYSSLMHMVEAKAIFNHPSGWFGRFEAIFRHQSNMGYAPVLADESFWQFNLIGGYRFHQRRGTIESGVLNLSDQDYRINPLSQMAAVPRERLFMLRFRYRF